MAGKYQLIIADRNRHICEFLKREFCAEGFEVEYAADDQVLLEKLCSGKLPDLLILDPGLLVANDGEIVDTLRGVMPDLPLVIHARRADFATHPVMELAPAIVEKDGDPIPLKSAVMDILKPDRRHANPGF